MENMTPEQLRKAANRKPQVRMSGRMAQCMEEIIRADIDKPVSEIPGAMRAEMSIEEGKEPEDFPPLLQLTRKVYTLRAKIRAEMGCSVKKDRKSGKKVEKKTGKSIGKKVGKQGNAKLVNKKDDTTLPDADQ